MGPFVKVVSLGALLSLAAGPATAGAVLDRVKHDGILRCGAVERPGLAEIDDGIPAGRAADLCRTVAEAVLGPGGRFAMRLLDLDSDFDHVRDQDIALAFLEPRTMAEQKLGSAMEPVTQAYADRFVLMVPEYSAARRHTDMAGQTICFMIGDPVWPLLDTDLKRQSVAFRPFGFSEEVEMKDAYNVGRCRAVAGVESELGELRQDGGVHDLKSRIIDEPLGLDPVLATVPHGDPEWAAIVKTGLDRP